MAADESEEARGGDTDATACARIARAAGAALLTVATDGTILEWFGAGDRLLGLHAPTAPASTWPMLFDPQRTEELWDALHDSETDTFRQQLRAFGGDRWIEVVGTRVHDEPDQSYS